MNGFHSQSAERCSDDPAALPASEAIGCGTDHTASNEQAHPPVGPNWLTSDSTRTLQEEGGVCEVESSGRQDHAEGDR
eukprot:2185681-Rhodomonas_salina.2